MPLCLKQHDIKYHCYPDDTQVYMTLQPCNKWDDISSSIDACIEDKSIWMNSNMLKLNKKEFIIFSSKQHGKKTENLHIKLRSRYIISSMSVRNLGLILYHILGMEEQVNSICTFCYY